MFKNRAAQVTFVKTPKATSETDTSPKTPHYSEQEIKILADLGRKIAVGAALGFVLVKFTDATCEIAVNNFSK